jgi:hypothetical protein
MQKVKQLPKPATVGDMWSWIGGITWVCKHLPRCQLLVVPLREMVKAVYDGKLGKERQKKQQLGWTAEGERAWEDMRDLLDHPKALAVPDVSRQFGVCVDASTLGVGAVLMQRQKEVDDPLDLDNWRPCDFFSKAWTTIKARQQPARGLELGGLVLALQHWAHLVRNSQTIHVWSDHRSLSQKIEPRPWDPAMVRKWMGELAVFPLDIHYLPGQLNTIADALSRAGFADESQALGGQVKPSLTAPTHEVSSC